MRLGIYTNTSKDEKLSIAANLVSTATQCNFEAEIINGTKIQDKKIDILVVVGGDGTILNVCEESAKANVPILSVNNGRMGFLTEIELFEFETALKYINAKKYTTESRMMMKILFNDKTFNALNEILVVKEKRNSISKIDIRCDGVFIDTYEGDGVIVSTPTGSTGYSLSSSGPILSPKINALVLTPLCVHSLHNRPIVFNENEVIEIDVQSRDDDNSIYIDGKEVATVLKKGTKISVQKSNLSVEFIKIGNRNFYDKLYTKLVQWNNFKKG